jgi:hypothetical protein
MALRDDFVRLGIIGGGVGINVGIASVDRDVAVGGGDAPLIIGAARGGNLDRLLFRPELCPGNRRDANQS